MGNFETAQGETFTLTSNSFQNGAKLPEAQVYNHFGCTGKNLSPHLKWQGAPKGTKSFAIIAHDPDAPRQNGWYHWVVYNIPNDVTSLKEGQQINPPMVQFKNDFGFLPYGGACPPKGHGVHHYNFTVYALDTIRLSATANTPLVTLENLIKKCAISSATLTAVYERK